MRVAIVRTSFIIVSLLALSGALSGIGSHGGFGTVAALAASSQQKAEARNYLNQVTASLRSVDTAYASGNAAEAQSKYEEARSNWDKSCSGNLGTRGARTATSVRLPRQEAERRCASQGGQIYRLGYAGRTARRHRARTAVEAL